MRFYDRILHKENLLAEGIKKVRAIIFFRALIVTILFGSFYLIEVDYSHFQSHEIIFYTIAFLYFLTIIYALVLQRVKSSYSIFIVIQILIDIFMGGIIVALTGGVNSLFSFVLFLNVISTSIMLDRKTSYIVATLCSIVFTSIALLQFYKIGFFFGENHLTHGYREYFYNVFFHINVFFLVAYLSSHPSEKLKKVMNSLKKRDIDLDVLRALNQNIIENVPCGLFTTDSSGRIAVFNRTARKIMGSSLADVIGRKPQNIFPFLKEMNTNDNRIEGKIEVEGKKILIGMSFSKLKDVSGRYAGVIGIFQDLTQLKALAAEVRKKEKMAAIGELSAGIAHELRNPLASLKGAIEMLREGRVSTKYGKHLMVIALSEMDRLNKIVTDFLMYAKPSEMKKKDFDIHNLIMNILFLMKNHDEKKKNINISSMLPGELFICGDPLQMQQVFWNLGMNAYEAMPNGGELKVYSKKFDDFVEINFSDTGIGIAKEDMEKIYYPFFTTKSKGSGLGLAISKRITEEHGGKIFVRKQGEGTTTFCVTLPLKCHG